ncbi:MAG TPA: hypothetical protein VGE72_05785 [Azospirillum sp.]
MIHFRSIQKAHTAVDGFFKEPFNDDADDREWAATWANLRQCNANAYFVLLWSQVEVEINRLCDELVRRKRSEPAWDTHRAWDLIGEHGPAGQKLRGPRDLMDRVALLCKKGGRVYNRLNELYRKRSRIAHGEILLDELDTAEVAAELEELIGELKATP